MIKTTVRISVFISFFIFIDGCQKPIGNSLEQMKKEIAETDKAMSKMAEKQGFHKAILFYADSSIVKFREGQYPALGKKEYEKFAGVHKDTKNIVWEPVNVEVAKSGELGYSWGNWKDYEKDTILYGNYFTVWKKQNDGTWKVALDGGGSTPKPKN